MYSDFVENQIAKQWLLLFNKKYDKILDFEQTYYHRITKNPDNLNIIEEEVMKEVITLCKEFPLYSSLSYN